MQLIINWPKVLHPRITATSGTHERSRIKLKHGRQSEAHPIVKEELTCGARYHPIRVPSVRHQCGIGDISRAVKNWPRLPALLGSILPKTQHRSHALKPRRHEVGQVPSTRGQRAKLVHQARRQLPHAVRIDEAVAVLDGHFDEEHAGEGRHAVQVRGHADDAGTDVRVRKDEVEGRGRDVDGLGGAVEEVVRDGTVVGETAEDVGVEVEFGEVEV